MPFVIMLAGAKGISEGGTGLVFIANTMPGLLCKLSSPYWFDKVSYETRIKAGTILMIMSFCIVSYFSHLDKASSNGNRSMNFNILMQLIGVALGSVHGSLGEASLLALCGKADASLKNNACTAQHDGNTYVATDQLDESRDKKNDDKPICISAFSSGTGLAGVLGFAFVNTCTNLLGFSLSITLLVALILPCMYWALFTVQLKQYTIEYDDSSNETHDAMGPSVTSVSHLLEETTQCQNQDHVFPDSDDEFVNNPTTARGPLSIGSSHDIHDSLSSRTTSELGSLPEDQVVNQMTNYQRFQLVLSLWPYMVPLFIVYAAEYALQSGVWTAIGFPPTDENQRKSFYVTSNWMYQAGVFISRSSGAFFTVPMWLLWLMPILQAANLVFFYLIATFHIFYNKFLFVGCFYAGLLGGSVYVQGYSRISKDLPVSVREFALASASVADSFGVILGDISGLMIQACIYRSNEIEGAVAVCPL